MSEEDFDLQAGVARVRDMGDETAARQLMERLYPLVLKLVRAHLPRRTDEEDLCQAVFMKVFAHIDQYSEKVPVEHWVSRIAVNTCLNEVKKEKVRPELRWSDLSEEEEQVIESLAVEDKVLDPAGAVAARELTEKLLARLSPAERLVVTLQNMEGRTIEEIRLITGWSGPMVKVRAFRARQKLRRIFDELMKESER